MVKTYKLVVYVPVESARKMRDLLNKLGAGNIANYDYASFSSKGTGRSRALEGANPAFGKHGEITEVEEEKIETLVSNVTQEKVEEIYMKLREAHPYEEPAIEVIEIKEFRNFK